MFYEDPVAITLFCKFIFDCFNEREIAKNIPLKRMQSTERSFGKINCTKAVDEEVQKLVSQGDVMKVPPEQVDHTQREWYLP